MSMATTPSSDTDWVQQYQQRAQAAAAAAEFQSSQYPRCPAPSSAIAAESTVVTTITTKSPTLSAVTPSTQQQSPGGGGGRAARTVRRRTRASRKAPTTLLNTDTTNFRAMVHQFTGAPPGTLPFTTFPPALYNLPSSGSGMAMVDFGQLPLQQQQVFAGTQLFNIQGEQNQDHQQLLVGGLFGLGDNTTSSTDPSTAAYFHGFGGSGGGSGDQRS